MMLKNKKQKLNLIKVKNKVKMNIIFKKKKPNNNWNIKL